MSEYRFHLQKYRPGSKTACPECGRKACFTRYVDEEAQVSFPDSVGKYDHINSCGYHYTPKAYFRDNPLVKEALIGQQRIGNNTTIGVSLTVKPSPNPAPKISYLPSGWVSSPCRGLTSTLYTDTL